MLQEIIDGHNLARKIITEAEAKQPRPNCYVTIAEASVELMATIYVHLHREGLSQKCVDMWLHNILKHTQEKIQLEGFEVTFQMVTKESNKKAQ